MLPFPGTAVLDLDPSAKSDFVLEDLDAFLLAHGVIAAGAVVGRNLYMVVSITSLAFTLIATPNGMFNSAREA